MASENDQIIRINYNIKCDFLYTDNRYLSDFIIGTKDGTRIYAHKYFLANVSKFFKNKIDLIPTLEYILLPDQFRSDIIKFVIFCMYKRYVCIRKTDLIAFLQAVKYLQLAGFEEVQMSHLECEKKLCVKIKRLTHEELEKAMGGKCNDQSHQIGNDSRKMIKATTQLEEKSVKKLKQTVTVEKNPSNKNVESASQNVSKQNERPKNEISEVISTTKRRSKKDDDVKLTQKSRRWQIINKGGQNDAFNGFSIVVNNNDHERKPARKSRGVTLKKEAVYVFDDSSDEESSKQSTSRSTKGGASKKGNLKPPQKLPHKRGGKKGGESTAKNTKKAKEKPKPSLNQSIGKTENEQEQEKLSKIATSNMNETFIIATSKQPVRACNAKRNVLLSCINEDLGTEAIGSGRSNGNDIKPALTERERQRKMPLKEQPVRACTKRNDLRSCINEDLGTGEIDSGLSNRNDIKTALAERERQRKMLLKEKENLPPCGSSRMANIKNNKKSSTTKINRRTVKKNNNQKTSAESDDVTEKNKCASKIDEFTVAEDEIHFDQIFGEISYESSVGIPIESNATPKENVTLTKISSPRTADRRPVSVKVVGSTPKPDGSEIKAPKRKATQNVSRNNVTETPMRKMPKRRRSIFGKPSKHNLLPSGTSSSHSQSRNEIPLKRSESRLLSETSDSDSESSGFKVGPWMFGSQSSIDSAR